MRNDGLQMSMDVAGDLLSNLLCSGQSEHRMMSAGGCGLSRLMLGVMRIKYSFTNQFNKYVCTRCL